MFERILQKARECIRRSEYVVSLHADEELQADGLTVFDLENAVLSGRIVQRQKDFLTGEWKYIIRGKGLARSSLTAAVKLSRTGKLVIITVYRGRPTNGNQR